MTVRRPIAMTKSAIRPVMKTMKVSAGKGKERCEVECSKNH
jgi:hypothetical protein